MNIAQKIKLLADQKALGIHKLHKLGNSYAITVPKMWVELHYIEINGEYYVRLEADEGRLHFSSIDLGYIESVVIKEKRK